MEVANIAPGSVDLVLTDLPYDADSIDKSIDDFCDVAYRMLKPTGRLVCYFGSENWATVGAAAKAAGFIVPPLIAVQYSSPIRYRETTATKWEPVLLAVKSHEALYGFYN